MIVRRNIVVLYVLLQFLVVALSISVNHKTHRLRPREDKRSNMDLAFIQLYELCDRDANGIFTPYEYPCLNDALSIFFGRK